MQCPDRVREIIVKILIASIGQIRELCNEGKMEAAHAAADHIHNLPTLLDRFDQKLLDFYWNVEKPAFSKSMPQSDMVAFASLWSELKEYVRET